MNLYTVVLVNGKQFQAAALDVVDAVYKSGWPASVVVSVVQVGFGWHTANK